MQIEALVMESTTQLLWVMVLYNILLELKKGGVEVVACAYDILVKSWSLLYSGFLHQRDATVTVTAYHK